LVENVTVFNNIFWMGNAQNSANGLDNCLTKGGGNHRYNNTYVGNPAFSQFYCVSPQADDGSAFDAENNVFVNCPIPIYINPSLKLALAIGATTCTRTREQRIGCGMAIGTPLSLPLRQPADAILPVQSHSPRWILRPEISCRTPGWGSKTQHRR
jgi:hypothetical protein